MGDDQMRIGTTFGAQNPALPPVWLRYRDAFAVLQYMSTLAGGTPARPIPWASVVAALGFTPEQGEALLAYMEALGFVDYRQGQREVGLTPAALAYLTGKRGRRCSLRPAAPSH